MSQSKDFYELLTPITDFLDLDNNAYYQQAPENWSVVLSDIQGSTKAIASGQYKLVNMLGASSIAAVVNALLHEGHSNQVPFVFGGDGATALIHQKYQKVVEASLIETQKRAQFEFGFSMRIGLVPHRDLIQAGTPVYVAKYEVAEGNCIAFFKGKGLTQAEKWIKSGRYLCRPSESMNSLDFDPQNGLSCRWAPLKSGRDRFLSVLIKLNDKNYHPEVLPNLIQQIDKIVDFNSPDTHPVKEQKITGDSIRSAVHYESGFRSRIPFLTALKIYAIFLLARVFERGILPRQVFDMKAYKRSLRTNSDFRKYDEVLRMVLDVNQSMVEQLRSLLEESYKSGLIFYGLHESETALMTCFVQSTTQNRHIHFIDGGDGGYAMASVQLKKQMACVSLHF